MSFNFTFHKKIVISAAFIVLLVFTGNIVCAVLNKKIQQPPAYTDYAGAAACVSCHRAICDSAIHTAHYRTSAVASKQCIKGNFEEGNNHFVYNNFLSVTLDSSEGYFWQTAAANGVEYESQPFDIVIGSGRKGQTYLYWSNNSLYQLPVSYYTPYNAWCNSPGFPVNFIQFNRQIPARCIECHGTFANAVLDADNKTTFNSTQILYGVTCERCHGPAAKHVAYYKEHPADTAAMFITKIKNLSRQQQLDACALCHSGARQAVQPAFSFQTSAQLADYSLPNYNKDSVSMLDVHGNQFGLLTASKCFTMSGMNCSSCHNTHVNESSNTALFSVRCATCHSSVKHTSFTIPAAAQQAFTSNCITCHMPVLASKKIVLQLSGKQEMTPDYVRSHRIAIYPEQTKAWLMKWK